MSPASRSRAVTTAEPPPGVSRDASMLSSCMRCQNIGCRVLYSITACMTYALGRGATQGPANPGPGKPMVLLQKLIIPSVGSNM